MLSSAAETYLGDDTLKSLLEEIGSSLSVYEVKAVILGAINNVDYIPPAKIIEAIAVNLEEQTPVSFKDQDQATLFYGQIFSCWNSMNAMEVAPMIFSPLPNVITVEAITKTIEERCKELTCFLTFLNAGVYLENFSDEKSIDAYCALHDLESELLDFLDFQDGRSDDENNLIEESVAHLHQLQDQWERCFPILKEELRLLRMKQMSFSARRQSAYSSFSLKQSSKNSPCECGSGKKFKRCCGLE